MDATAAVSADEGHAGGPAAVEAPSPEVGMGLRERRRLETFRALQAAARRLAGERGLANVTVDEIAAAAGLSKRTFFNYFDSKEGAIFDREPGRVERLAGELAARPPEEPPLQALRAACVATLRCHARELQELTALASVDPALSWSQLTAFGGFEEAIVEWAAARTGTDPEADVYPALLAGVTNVMRQLTVARWEPESGDEGFIRLAEEIFDLLADGLAGPRR